MSTRFLFAAALNPRIVLAVTLAISLWSSSSLRCEKRYLKTNELALVAGTSLVVLGGSQLLGKIDSTRSSLIPDPLPVDRWAARHLGGSWCYGKSNFLDKSVGSLVTPAITGMALIIVNGKWPQENATKDIVQDVALFSSGILFTEGVTSIVKTAVARPRPYLELESELASTRESIDVDDDRRSFFSAHMSSHTFSVVYFNKRLRRAMRDNMPAESYRHWRWAPPLALFSWAGYVGWSRINAYQHYLSDVVVGAVVGAAAGEFFFRLGDGKVINRLSIMPTTRGLSARLAF